MLSDSIVTADHLRAEKGKKLRKVVATLAGYEKKFVMNKTNCNRIAEVYGNQAVQWAGKVIVIKPDWDKFGNEDVECIRVDVKATRRASEEAGAKPAKQPDLKQVLAGIANAQTFEELELVKRAHPVLPDDDKPKARAAFKERHNEIVAKNPKSKGSD